MRFLGKVPIWQLSRMGSARPMNVDFLLLGRRGENTVSIFAAVEIYMPSSPDSDTEDTFLLWKLHSCNS
jgi:hypothetical protein